MKCLTKVKLRALDHVDNYLLLYIKLKSCQIKSIIIIHVFLGPGAKMMSLLHFPDHFQENFLLYKLNFGWKVSVSHFIKLSPPSLLKSEPRNCMIILEKEPRQLNSKYLSFHLWLSWRQNVKACEEAEGVQGIISTGQFD